MASPFRRGTTIKCWRYVKDSAGTKFDPATSFKLTIRDNYNGLEVDNADMVKDAVGEYHYNYTVPTTVRAGTYTATFTATDGADVGVYVATFEVD